MSSSLHDHDHATLPPPRTVEVAGGVFAYIQPDGSWWINNTGFLAGRSGVVAVDSCSTERRTRAWLDAIRSVTDRPLRALINTHHHGDHTHGNHLFRRYGPVTIVGHENCRTEILAAGPPGPHYALVWGAPDWGEVVLAPPVLTFRDAITVWVDDLRCEVRHLGTPAHTTNDSVVWLPDRKVLFTGDLLFNGGTPFVPMGSVAGSLVALDRIRKLGAETLVPGHGPVCTPTVLEDLTAYFRFVQETARAGKAAGLSPLELARQTDLGPFAGLTDPERIVGNLHRAYAELDGAEPGAPINIVAALRDMVIFHGGPLRCLA